MRASISVANAHDHGENDVTAADERRQQLAGPSGVAGLMKNLRLLGICLVTSFGGLNYGYEQGSYGQCMAMKSFQSVPAFNRIVTDSGYQGWTVAVLALGGWVGSLGNAYCCDRFSRRWSILGGALICLLGTILTAAAMNAEMIFAGRFFIGLAVGSLSTAVPMYNSEISPAEVRGTMVGTWQLTVTFGIMVSYWVGFGANYISETSSVPWRLTLAIQAIPAVSLAIGTFFIPYSPRWLLSKGRDEEALQVLARVRNLSIDDEVVRLEFLSIKADSIFEKENAAEKFPHLIGKPFRLQLAQVGVLFSSWPMFRRTAITCLMMFFQQMGGISAIVYYAPIIFKSLGLTGSVVSLLASGVVGIAMFVATIPALLIIDKVGRRPLIIVGGIGMASCLVVVAGIAGKYDGTLANNPGAAWACAAFIWQYIFHFGYSWGPVSWVVISELMPMSARAAGTALGASANWMTNFCVSMFMPPMLKGITFGTYIFFLAFLIMGVSYAIFLLPETKNVGLEAMDRAFKSNDATRDAAKMHAIVERLHAAEYGDSASSTRGEKREMEKVESV